MEFQQVVNRRRMVRSYVQDRPVPPDVVERIVHNALRAPRRPGSRKAPVSWCSTHRRTSPSSVMRRLRQKARRICSRPRSKPRS